jgi:hypothetical protein
LTPAGSRRQARNAVPNITIDIAAIGANARATGAAVGSSYAALPALPTCSHKIEFSFLNGNLMVPAGHPSIFKDVGYPMDSATNDY